MVLVGGKMGADDLQDHRIEVLESRVGRHGESLDELTSNVAVLSESVNTTNTLLRESLSVVKKMGAGIMAVMVTAFGAGQVM
jgi:uncharacterized coiled-coil protein SlyX